MNITFKTGHGARHLRGTTLNVNEVEGAITESVLTTMRNATAIGGSFWGRVTVATYLVEFRGYALGMDQISVGTYYVVRTIA